MLISSGGGAQKIMTTTEPMVRFLKRLMMILNFFYRVLFHKVHGGIYHF